MPMFEIKPAKPSQPDYAYESRVEPEGGGKIDKVSLIIGFILNTLFK